jgi:hypothetical protein
MQSNFFDRIFTCLVVFEALCDAFSKWRKGARVTTIVEGPQFVTSFLNTLVLDASPVAEDHDCDDREEDERGVVGDHRVPIS